MEICTFCEGRGTVLCGRCGERVMNTGGFAVPGNAPAFESQYWCRECHDTRFVRCDNCYRSYVRTEEPLSENGRCHRCEQANWGCEFKADGRITRTKSDRLFGVELETASLPKNFRDLMAGLPFRTVHDGSVTGKEIISRPMSGDKGLEAITELCGKLRSATVDKDCGFHLHLDARDLNHTQLWNIVMGYRCTQKTWFSFVHPSRHNNQYCQKMGVGPLVINRSYKSCRSLGEYAAVRDYEYRYKWFNIMAYQKHRTLEVRLHSGTMNAEKINNWVIAHTRFWEWLIHQPEPDTIRQHFNRKNVWNKLVNIWESDTLAQYFTARREQFASDPELVEV